MSDTRDKNVVMQAIHGSQHLATARNVVFYVTRRARDRLSDKELDARVALTVAAVNKQLNDKERVAAALENPNLLEKVDLCLSGQTAM